MPTKKVAYLKEGDIVLIPEWGMRTRPAVVKSVELEYNWLMEPLFYSLLVSSVNPDTKYVFGLEDELEIV